MAPAAWLVLTASAGVSDDQASGIAGAVPGAGLPHRLADTAVEIGLADAAVTIPATAGLDANVVAADHRVKKLLVADMDSTIISVECIDELADFAGQKARVAAITERAMRGELDFEAAIHARVAVLADLPLSVLDQCYRERVRLNPGAEALVRTMRANGAMTALVSGGFTFFTRRVAELAGFTVNRANLLLQSRGRLTGKVALPVLGQQAKRDALIEFRDRAGLHEAETLAVGDGANDLAMVAEAGLGVAYRAKPALRARATAVLDHSDLTAILALQGYHQRGDGDWSLSAAS
jgi:phosphoserine phosphatase